MAEYINKAVIAYHASSGGGYVYKADIDGIRPVRLVLCKDCKHCSTMCRSILGKESFYLGCDNPDGGFGYNVDIRPGDGCTHGEECDKV